MNFMLRGSYLIMAAFVLCILWKRGTVRANRSVLGLCFLALSYFLFEMLSCGTINFRIIAAPCAFLTAYNLADGTEEYEPTKILRWIAVAMALHSTTSLFYNLRMGGVSAFSSGVSYDAWSKEISTATGIAMYYVFLAAAIPLMMLRPKWYHIAIFALSLFHDVLIGGRTFLAVSAIALALTVLFRAFTGKRRVRASIKYTTVVIAAAAVLFFAYQNDYFNIRSGFESSYLYYRFFRSAHTEDLSATSRWERKIIYLQNLFTYPWGGNHLRDELKIGYAHDIWLDTFDKAGLVSLACMLAYTISSVFRVFRYARSSRVDFRERIVFSVFPIVMMVAFFVEPIIQGAPMVFFMYCFMDGLLCGKQNKKGNSYENSLCF